MKRICTFGMLIVFHLGLLSQGREELSGTKFWFCVDSVNVVFSGSRGTEEGLCINFHSVFGFSGDSSYLSRGYNYLQSGRLTVMTVYYSLDTLLEQGIWSFRHGEHLLSGLSDRRLFRRRAGFSYPVFRRGLPSVNTSKQSLSGCRFLSDSVEFQLGMSYFTDSSVHYFTGYLAECMVWDRLLDKTHTLQWESYLAIKYGITLLHSDYLSSHGEKVWDYGRNKLYSNDISGICFDSGWGLSQKQSGSSGLKDSLAIFLGDSAYRYNSDNQHILHDGSFLLWGNNGKELQIDTFCHSGYLLSSCRWLVQSTHWDSSNATLVRYPLGSLLQSHSTNLYLLIDRSGVGDFAQMDVFSPSYVDSQYIYYQSVRWDTDQSGRDVFCFGYGFQAAVSSDTSCLGDHGGSLHVSICGGYSPYFQTITDSMGNCIAAYTTQGDTTLSHIGSGAYIVHIQDATGILWEGEIRVPFYPEMIIELPFQANLVNDELHGFDIIKGAYLYRWFKSDTLYSVSETIQVSDTGTYILFGEDVHGCVQSVSISVGSVVGILAFESGQDQGCDQVMYPLYKIYPNPSSGYFILEAQLGAIGFLSIEIYSIQGQLITKLYRSGNSYYRLEEYLRIPGEYIVRFISEEGTEDKKFTIKR